VQRLRDLLFAEIRDGCNQGGAARRLVPVISDGNAVDGVVGTAFGDRAVDVPLDGTNARIADACNGDAAHHKLVRTYTDHLPAMGSRVAETDHVGHRSTFFVR
jgi:hypothetical protein